VARIERVSLDLAVVLGTATMPVHQVLRLGRGAVIELEGGDNDEVQILANNFPVAKGAVVINGSKIGVEIREMLPRPTYLR
jgi:flagellar motor switch protein FliN